MPILPIIYICALAAAFGSGWFYGWHGEYAEVVALEQQLNSINTQSQKLLSATQAHNLEQTIKQQEQIAVLETKYNDQISSNDSLNAQLVDAQRVRRTASAASDCRAVSKNDSARRGQKNNDTGLNAPLDTPGFSERFDSFVSRKAKQADKIDADRKLLIDWVKTIPSEMIQ
jgi:hypothetical protein